MNSEFQAKLRGVIYAVFAVIIGIVLIRIFFKLIGANPTNEFTSFWYDFSNVFVEPWAIIYKNIRAGDMVIELYSIVAVLFYLILSYVTSKSAGSPFEDSRKQAIAEIVDSVFKILEFLLIARFVLKLTSASTTAAFVRLIYDLSSFVYEPFATILPQIKSGTLVLEISTLVALIVIIILDLVTEELIYSLLDAIIPDKKQRGPKQSKQGSTAPQPLAPMPVNQPTGQNITINIPQQPPLPPTYVDRRSVNVVPPQDISRPPQQRGFLQRPSPRSSRAGGGGK